MTTQEQAQKYFENNPATEVLFSTSDGTLFLREIDAINHSKTLEDHTVGNHQNKQQAVQEVIVPKNFLDNSIPVIIGWMDNFTKDEIYSYLEAEKKGKKRVSLIKALEEQLAKFENTDQEDLSVESTSTDDVQTDSPAGDVEESEETTNTNEVE